jgi:anti-sigma factor RsiW
MSEFDQHDAVWNDRLQDLLDQESGATERAVTEAHLASCGRCRAQYAYLKRIDAELSLGIGSSALDHTFDRQLFARIESNDAQAREKARRRLQRELEDNLEQLSRGWKRTVVFIAGGALAGVALAFSCVAWASSATLTHRLAGAVAETAGFQIEPVQLLISVLLVGGIGAILGRWFAAHAE